MTPLQLASDQEVVEYLRFIHECFDGAKIGNHEVIERLKVLPGFELRIIAGTTNTQGITMSKVASLAGHKDLANELMAVFNVIENYHD